MKNVAGFDVARLMTGALGTLGVITEVSLKCLPLPKAEATLAFECSADEAIRRVNEWGTQPLPVSATCYHHGRMRVRLSGAQPAVAAAAAKLGGERVANADGYWAGLRDHTHPFFTGTRASDVPLWRLSVKSTAPYTDLGGEQLIEWGGGLRWLAAGERTDAQRVRLWAAANGGHATLFRATDKSAGAFQPLTATLQRAAPAAEGGVRSARHPQPRPALSGILSADAHRPMQTDLSAEFRDTPEGREADAILRSCVHCGFCTATCPTYQLLGDELDGPRGRIYLIKQVLEGDAGHAEDAAAPRPLPDLPQLRDDLPVRRAIRPPARHRPRDRRAQGRPHAGGGRAALEPAPRAAVGFAVRRGDLVRADGQGIAAARTGRSHSRRRRAPATWPAPRHARKMLLMEGCVQPALKPNIDAAAARVFDRIGISRRARAGRRMLRRAVASPERRRRGARHRPPQHRRMVAARASRAWRRSS